NAKGNASAPSSLSSASLYIFPHLSIIICSSSISFSNTNTAKDSQFMTSKKGGTKLSDMITGTHS
ncbi:LOW QUALITY PROTEIN: hypothetical protein HID58_057174, partial [Brassica napus]